MITLLPQHDVLSDYHGPLIVEVVQTGGCDEERVPATDRSAKNEGTIWREMISNSGIASS